MTVISNTRRGSGEERAEEATAIQWTLWGKQAENAAEYLGKGSHVNVVGRLRNNNYTDNEGADVYRFGFTCEEIDYLETKAQAEAREARRTRPEGAPAGEGQTPAPAKANGRSRKARTEPQSTEAALV